jgi:hypothetical protein
MNTFIEGFSLSLPVNPYKSDGIVFAFYLNGKREKINVLYQPIGSKRNSRGEI